MAKSKEQLLHTTLESAPDAVVGVDANGKIVLANDRAAALFGYERSELVGEQVERLLPEHARAAHVGHRAGYMADPRPRPMGTGLDFRARRKDGTEFPVDISLTTVATDHGPIVTAFVRDMTDRSRVEQAALLMLEAKQRRGQALEINDNIVQGIAAAVLALEASQPGDALRALDSTLEAARHMMAGLLAEQTGQVALAPGDLLRAKPATSGAIAPRRVEPLSQAPARPITVLIADDSEDIRLMLRSSLTPREFSVVAEAANGAEAILRAKDARPDVVLLDLAMPVMDGLQALPRIKAVSPSSRIVVLSGYGRNEASAQALQLGADAYVEKGRRASELASLLRSLFPDRGSEKTPDAPSLQERLASGSDLEQLLATFSHELRTALTVIQGIAVTLEERMDVLPSPVVRELIQGMIRNTTQMSGLIDAFSDARIVGEHGLDLVFEDTDIVELVHEIVSDLHELLRGHALTIHSDTRVAASVDRQRIRQVLTNLLSNAAKFGGEGTPIDIGVRASPTTVLIAVTDHGNGIPPERAVRLFGRAGAGAAGTSGLGLGLYIARGIALAHGGDLELARSDEHGSTFRVSLPTTRPV